MRLSEFPFPNFRALPPEGLVAVVVHGGGVPAAAEVGEDPLRQELAEAAAVLLAEELDG